MSSLYLSGVLFIIIIIIINNINNIIIIIIIKLVYVRRMNNLSEEATVKQYLSANLQKDFCLTWRKKCSKAFVYSF